MQKKVENYLSTKCHIEKSATLEAPVRLYGSAKIAKNVKVGRFSYLNTRSTLHSGTSIGRYCSIGKNVEVGPFDHPMDSLSTSPVSYNAHLHFPEERDWFVRTTLKRAKGVVIGNDVWIGSNTIIKRGLTIGHGAIIGAASIVTKDVAPYAIVAGVPAREIRKRFDEATIARLLALQWWDMPVEVVGQLSFDDLEACLDALERYKAQESVKCDAVAASDPALVQAGAVPVSDKGEVVEALRRVIEAIPPTAAKPILPAQQEFVDLLKQKLENADIPSPVIDFIESNGRKFYSDYEVSDYGDQVILNNKIMRIAELSVDGLDGQELPNHLQKSIMNILSTKW
jgi:acetyltransferase-like isoleucine patch superfamily enzyme